jgi:NAD(P)-dependent dehydrogenase (short-subunit alcohol dehydrogenase family)
MVRQRHRKNALVTDGIGKEIALRLAQAGHRVLALGRDTAKGERAAQEIRRRSKIQKKEKEDGKVLELFEDVHAVHSAASDVNLRDDRGALYFASR